MYDVAFISYKSHEPEASDEYLKLLTTLPNRVFRIDGVKGIHNAHKKAAELAETEMFYVVDGDARIMPTFKFDMQLAESDESAVYVWRAINTAVGLEYGYGGVKLLPKHMTMMMDVNSVDMTMSISPRFVVMNQLSNITDFNTDPLNAWRSAFRECVKLSSKIIAGQLDDETTYRLDAWLYRPSSAKNIEYVRSGAMAGTIYGLTHKGSPEDLAKINDYTWLSNEFKKTGQYGNNPGFFMWKTAFLDTVLETNKTASLRFGDEDFYPEYVKGGRSAGKWYKDNFAEDDTFWSNLEDESWLREQYKSHIEMFPPETFI